MKKRNIIITILVIVALVAVIVIKLVNNKQILDKHNQIVDRSHIPVPVNTAKVVILPLDKDIVRPATVAPNETAVISATMPGKIAQLNIELGDRVTKGQVIGKIDTKATNIQLQNLQLAVEKLKNDFQRNKDLYEGNALSKKQFLDSKFAYQSKKLQMEQLQQQIEDANIKSPLNGIITKKDKVAGEFVGGGTPLATVVDVNLLKIDVYVNESEVRFIHLKDSVEIYSSLYPDTSFIGIVSYISPNADQNFNYQVEIVTQNSKKGNYLRPGNYVKVHFIQKNIQNAIQIPLKALISGVKDAHVYVVNGNHVNKVAIKVGRTNGANIEVLEGLKPEDIVVTDGQINLVDNSLIESKN